MRHLSRFPKLLTLLLALVTIPSVLAALTTVSAIAYRCATAKRDANPSAPTS